MTFLQYFIDYCDEKDLPDNVWTYDTMGAWFNASLKAMLDRGIKARDTDQYGNEGLNLFINVVFRNMLERMWTFFGIGQQSLATYFINWGTIDSVFS